MSNEFVDVPQEVIVGLCNAMDAYKACNKTLYDSWHQYNLPNELRWVPWSVANELRYVGQHICRVLCAEDEVERQTEIARAKSHCERAIHDAHDYLILCFVRIILGLLKIMEENAMQDGCISDCNIAKQAFCEICDDLAQNDRKSPDFETCRRKNIARLSELFRKLMGGHVLRAEDRKNFPKQDFVVITTSEPIPVNLRKVFNKTETCLKKYEFVAGKVSISGIKNLCEATCYLAKNDVQTFMEMCYYAQVNALRQIAMCFSGKLGLKLDISDEELQGKDIDEVIIYLERIIIDLEKRWCMAVDST